jgi:hypothetical protein
VCDRDVGECVCLSERERVSERRERARERARVRPGKKKERRETREALRGADGVPRTRIVTLGENAPRPVCDVV